MILEVLVNLDHPNEIFLVLGLYHQMLIRLYIWFRHKCTIDSRTNKYRKRGYVCRYEKRKEKKWISENLTNLIIWLMTKLKCLVSSYLENTCSYQHTHPTWHAELFIPEGDYALPVLTIKHLQQILCSSSFDKAYKRNSWRM